MHGFYCKPERARSALSQGYVKAIIITVDGEDGNRHETRHPSSPLYAPFSFGGKSYQLHHEKAVMAFDVAPSYVHVFKHQWELRALNIPKYERERMDTIFRKMEKSLETLVQKAVPLSEKTSKSRGRFLGTFPTPLREGFNEADCYGTIGAGVRFNVYIGDLPSRRGEFEISHQPDNVPVYHSSPRCR